MGVTPMAAGVDEATVEQVPWARIGLEGALGYVWGALGYGEPWARIGQGLGGALG
jgi:hypothetical protein